MQQEEGRGSNGEAQRPDRRSVGRRRRTGESNSLRNEQRGELVQKERLDDGGRKATADEPTWTMAHPPAR